jgi:protein TonB
MKYLPSPRLAWPAVAALLASCGSVPLPPDTPAGVASAPPAAAPAQAAAAPVSRNSSATSQNAYRTDAASHIYGLNQERIWKGRMPPLLYAIGVLDVEVDGRGNVRTMSWRRAPKHAPEVIAAIEKTVRDAAPFPAPVRLGRVTYTDVWLWHESGRFQLHTLTEGQD